jgi:tetratricopeptide (TPR) repeat protein
VLFLCAITAAADTSPCPQSSPHVKAALDNARKNAEQIKEDYHRSTLLEEVAKGYAADGDFDSALEVIRTDSAFMWQATDELGGKMLSCGQVAKVKEVAPTLDGRSRSFMFEWLAEWGVRHDDSATSEYALSEIKDSDIRTATLVNIFIIRAKNGDVKTAAAEYEQALEGSSGPLTDPKDALAENMALAYALKGDVADAIATLKGMKSVEKIYALYAIADILAEKHEAANSEAFSMAALEMSRPFLEDTNQAYPISLLASALGKLGSFETAIKLANSISDEQRKSEATTMIAVHLIESGDERRAQELMATLPPMLEGQADAEAAREMGWVRIAMAESNAGHGDLALQTLGKIRDPRIDGLVQWQTAYAEACAGRLKEARATTERIPATFPPGERGEALRLVAAVDAHENGAPDVTKWVESLSTSDDRADGYLGVADGLLKKPEQEIPPYTQD